MPNPDPTAGAVRSWLAAVLRGEAPALPPDLAANPEGIIDVAAAEGVAALCHYQLSASAAWGLLPPSLREDLAGAARGAMAATLLWEIELRGVLAALAAEGIPVLILKGAALAYSLYPAPHLRPRSDADLLVPSLDHAKHAWRVLETLGYQRLPVSFGDLIVGEVPCYRTGPGEQTHTLDLHWRLNSNAVFSNRFSFAELESAAILVPELGPHAKALGAPQALLFAAMHRVTHMPEGKADLLIWLYDVHLLCGRLSDQLWRQTLVLAEARALRGPLLDGLGAAHAWMGTVVPDEVLKRLRDGAKREPSFHPHLARKMWYLQWLNFRALPSPAARLRWLLQWVQWVFPNPGFMRESYGFKHALWLPWFYGVRLVRTVARLLYRTR